MSREPARPRRAAIRILALLVSIGLGAGCDRGPEVGPPPTPDVSQADPDVAAFILARVRDVKANPGDGPTRGALAAAYDANAFATAALEVYEQASVLAPENPRWLYHRAYLLSESGKIEAALSLMDECVHRNPRYGPAHWRRGQWLLDLGRVEEAEMAFRAALEVSPASVAAKVGLARVRLQQGEASAAVTALEALVREHPSEPYFRQLLASALRHAGETERASEQAALAANPAEPEWADVWREELEASRVGFAADLQRATGLAGSGRTDEAIAIFEQLKEKRPTDITLLTNLGAAYSDAGRLEEAASTLSIVVEQDKNHFGANLNLGSVYHRLGEPSRARQHADRAVESNPTLPEARILRGIVLVTLGQREEAIADFDAAQRYDPETPLPATYTGTVHNEVRRWGAAIESFRIAIARDARYTPAYFGLAYAQAKAGDLDGAQTTLARAAQMAPGAPQVTEIGNLIDALRKRD